MVGFPIGGRQRSQRGQQRLAVVRDRLDVVPVEQAREHTLGDFPVREHVRDAARYAQVVLEHDEAAVFEANQVGPGDRHVDVLVDADATHLAAVVAAAVDQFRRHHAFGEDSTLVVDVLEEQVDGGQPLSQTPLERVPLTTRDDPGQQIEREDPFSALIVSVDGERDALGEERAIGLELALTQLLRRLNEQFLDQGTVVRPCPPVGVEHLVVRRVEAVLREQRPGGRLGSRRLKRRHELEG